MQLPVLQRPECPPPFRHGRLLSVLAQLPHCGCVVYLHIFPKESQPLLIPVCSAHLWSPFTFCFKPLSLIEV